MEGYHAYSGGCSSQVSRQYACTIIYFMLMAWFEGIVAEFIYPAAGQLLVTSQLKWLYKIIGLHSHKTRFPGSLSSFLLAPWFPDAFGLISSLAQEPYWSHFYSSVYHFLPETACRFCVFSLLVFIIQKTFCQTKEALLLAASSLPHQQLVSFILCWRAAVVAGGRLSTKSFIEFVFLENKFLYWPLSLYRINS